MEDKRTIEEVAKGIKRKIKPESVHQMRGNMFKIAQVSLGSKCGSCGKVFEKDDIGSSVGVIIHKPELKKTNSVVCMECIEYLETKGVKNLEHDIKDTKDKLELLRKERKEQLKEMGGRLNGWVESDIDQKSLEHLEEIVKEGRKELEDYRDKKEKIEGVDTSKWEELEEYLKDQYDVIEDRKYLKHELQIEEYFEEIYRDFFECGQGYYQDEAEVIVRIGDKFYEVTLVGELMSQKQDVGDRLYWIDNLEYVTYRVIDKPVRKEEFYFIQVSEKDYERVIELLNQEGIEDHSK